MWLSRIEYRAVNNQEVPRFFEESIQKIAVCLGHLRHRPRGCPRRHPTATVRCPRGRWRRQPSAGSRQARSRCSSHLGRPVASSPRLRQQQQLNSGVHDTHVGDTNRFTKPARPCWSARLSAPWGQIKNNNNQHQAASSLAPAAPSSAASSSSRAFEEGARATSPSSSM